MTQTQAPAAGGQFLTVAATSNEVFVREDLTDEQRLFGQTAAEFMQKEVLPVVERLYKHDWELTRQLLEKAAELVTKVRPFVRKFHSSEYLNALASGEICLVLGFSGDIKQAQKRASEAKNGVDIGYAIPKEGAQLWFDNLAIPRDARHPAEAHALVNFLLRPEIAAKNTSFIAYANGVVASRPFVDKAILEDRGIYPNAATMAHLYTKRSGWHTVGAAA